MKNLNETNNNVQLIGTINSAPEIDHYIYGEGIYQISLKIGRASGSYDIIPILISERLINISDLKCGDKIFVVGRYSSYNLKVDNKSSLILYVFATDIEFVDDDIHDMNIVTIEGNLCKNPIYRQTPLGREISDVLLAVNRQYGKSDYIPCICWGRNAKFVSSLNVGDTIRIIGRIQSREYQKNDEIKVAQEISISQINVIFNNEDNVA